MKILLTKKPYQRTVTNYDPPFNTYIIQHNGRWYQLRGKNLNKLEAGMEIEVEEVHRHGRDGSIYTDLKVIEPEANPPKTQKQDGIYELLSQIYQMQFDIKNINEFMKQQIAEIKEMLKVKNIFNEYDAKSENEEFL